ncbi:MAG: hypothetical protein MK193_13015 [Lentisphaeria bacterium]|nr:hypothetical protein [Lentisphaeria bacterium]
MFAGMRAHYLAPIIQLHWLHCEWRSGSIRVGQVFDWGGCFQLLLYRYLSKIMRGQFYEFG